MSRLAVRETLGIPRHAKFLGVETSPPDATAASNGFVCNGLVAATASGSLSALFRGWQLPVRFEPARREPARVQAQSIFGGDRRARTADA